MYACFFVIFYHALHKLKELLGTKIRLYGTKGSMTLRSMNVLGNRVIDC
jgi:hypothetical protein